MPGVTGFIRPNASPDAERELSMMADVTCHEKFYVRKSYVNRGLGLYVAWTAHPGSIGSRMPIVSVDNRYVLILVGEHFPADDCFEKSNLLEDTKGWGEQFFQRFQQSEQEALRSLNGWFAGLVVDQVLKKVSLFNDRYGMGRIYWHEGEEEFIFGSEAKSLLLVRPKLRDLNLESLAEFLKFNCVLGNKSLFRGISLLPGGSSWVFNRRPAPQKNKYFDFAKWEEQPLLSRSEFYEQFDQAISRIVPKYTMGPNTVGISLTAGLDTRLILAALSKERTEFPCYTFGGLWGEIFDISTARKLAQMCRTSHEVIKINESFLRDFGSYAERSVFISDGCHDSLGAHDVYFNEIARQIAPVRLTGKFGSEVVRMRRLIHPGDFPKQSASAELRRALTEARLHTEEGIHPLTSVVSEQVPWSEFGRLSVEQAATILRTPYMDNEVVRLMYQGGPEIRASRDLQASYVKSRSEDLASVPTDMGKIWPGHEGLSSATLFPYRVLCKIEYIYLYNMPHWLTRIDRSMSSLKPERLIVGRQKFEAYRIWMKTYFADYIQGVLLKPSAKATDFFDKAWINKIVNGHLAGTHNYLHEVNKMLTLELICSSLLGSLSLSSAAEKSSHQISKQPDAEQNVLPVQ
jgi:asparagine synthase (glutamine-hydrolysing)